MKKIIIIAIVSLTSTVAFAQNNNDADRNYSKVGLTQDQIQIRENYFKEKDLEAKKRNELIQSQVSVPAVSTTIVSDPTDGVKSSPAAPKGNKAVVDPKKDPSVVNRTSQPLTNSQTDQGKRIEKSNTSSSGFINTK